MHLTSCIMNATELQHKLKIFLNRVIVLCESLPSEKSWNTTAGQVLPPVFAATTKYKIACKAEWNQGFKAKLSISLDQILEEFSFLETLVDLGLIPVAKFPLIVAQVTELTSILAPSKMTFEKSSGQNRKS